MYAVGRKEREYEEVLLPDFDIDRISYFASKFKGNTGRGSDGARPHHYKLLASGAKAALIRIFRCIEKFRRWPWSIRSVVEIALGKKAGGSRLIGLATSLYRLWTRVRYADCCSVLEARVARPYLTAAPGRGAARAAFDAAFETEAAAARGEVAATTCFDLRQYFEQVTVEEIALGGRRFGLPRVIAVLLGHLYSGPRRVRVGDAISAPTYPRRSVLAGCTFATPIVRLISVGPVDILTDTIRKRTKGWDITTKVGLHVDDGMVTTAGDIQAVCLIHPWASKTTLDWVRKALRKETALGKTTCITSPRTLKMATRDEMMSAGVQVEMEGELLGVDYAAGGKMRRRRVQAKRRAKGRQRLGKLRWLWRQGGQAKAVARDGICAEMKYGDEIVGLPNSVLRDMRRSHAAVTSIKVAGASTTAKLALGGNAYSEFDPAVLQVNPPLAALLGKIWDQPRSRSSFIRSWRQAEEEVAQTPAASRWSAIRGPVGAAWAHLLRVQGAWPRPFTIHIMDSEINIRQVPPIQVMLIMKAHARRYL